MTRAAIAGLAVVAVLGAGAVTAATVPGLTNAHQSVGAGQGSVPVRMHSAGMPGGTSTWARGSMLSSQKNWAPIHHREPPSRGRAWPYPTALIRYDGGSVPQPTAVLVQRRSSVTSLAVAELPIVGPQGRGASATPEAR